MGKTSVRTQARRAFVATLPVMCGYLFMGVAFGILLNEAGYSFLWAFAMGVLIYAGTMQYMAIPFLAGQVGLATVALTTLLVHVRHFVYGLSFIRRFRPMGKRKYYIIFGLTDETYALLCAQPPARDGQDETLLFLIALFDHIYWIVGCTLGGLAGSLLTIDTTGIDFAMTALFIVICVDQWRTARTHLPALIGGGAAVLALCLFGPDQMLIPAIGLIVACCILLRRRLEPVVSREEASLES